MKTMKQQHVSKVLLFALMFLLLASLSPATAFTISDDDTTTETEDETESMHDDDMHDVGKEMSRISKLPFEYIEIKL